MVLGSTTMGDRHPMSRFEIIRRLPAAARARWPSDALPPGDRATPAGIGPRAVVGRPSPRVRSTMIEIARLSLQLRLCAVRQPVYDRELGRHRSDLRVIQAPHGFGESQRLCSSETTRPRTRPSVSNRAAVVRSFPRFLHRPVGARCDTTVGDLNGVRTRNGGARRRLDCNRERHRRRPPVRPQLPARDVEAPRRSQRWDRQRDRELERCADPAASTTSSAYSPACSAT